MANLILTQPNRGSGSGNSFETIIADTGSVIAGLNDTLALTGGNAITTSATTSPDVVTFDVVPSEINLGELGDVNIGSPILDGYTLVYRTGSPDGWVAEPSTTTDEFVKTSGTDTTTGHLNDKIVTGTYTTKTILNIGGDEDLKIDIDPSTINIGDLGNVDISGSPDLPSDGDVLIYTGSPASWQNIWPYGPRCACSGGTAPPGSCGHRSLPDRCPSSAIRWPGLW